MGSPSFDHHRTAAYHNQHRHDHRGSARLPQDVRRRGNLHRVLVLLPGVCIQEGQSLEVTLHPDGSATGLVHFLSPSTEGFLEHTDGSYTGGGCAGSSNEFDLELTGTYEPPPPGDDQRGSVFLDLEGNRWLEGTFGRADMSIDYLRDTFMEQFAANTGLSDPRLYGHYEFPMMEVISEA